MTVKPIEVYFFFVHGFQIFFMIDSLNEACREYSQEKYSIFSHQIDVCGNAVYFLTLVSRVLNEGVSECVHVTSLVCICRTDPDKKEKQEFLFVYIY